MAKRKKYGLGTSGGGVLNSDLLIKLMGVSGGNTDNEEEGGASAMSSIGNMATGALASGFANAMGGLMDTLNSRGEEYRPVRLNTNRVMRTGGVVGGVPVKVEGGEVAQTPQGDNIEFQGESHEGPNGGIDANLPERTKIYSAALSVDGKTMADRKKARERRKEKMVKLLNSKQGDSTVMNTVKRTLEALATEEKHDLIIQQAAKEASQEASQNTLLQEGGEEPTQKMRTGTASLSRFNKYFTTDTSEDSVASTKAAYDVLQQLANRIISGQTAEIDKGNQWLVDREKILNGETQTDQTTQAPVTAATDIIPLAPFASLPPAFDLSSAGNTASDNTASDVQNQSLVNAVFDDETRGTATRRSQRDRSSGVVEDITAPYTTGDKFGFAGIGQGALGPMMTTFANRMGDEENLNHYKDFGTDAIKELKTNKGLLKSLKDSSEQDIDLSLEGIRRANNNSTRGLSTRRALDIASWMAALGAKRKAADSYSDVLLTYGNKLSQAENIQDQMVMQGAEKKALEDKGDRDNFYTQLNSDQTNMANQLQNTGKNMNKHKMDEDFLSILPYLSTHGIGFSYDGKGKRTFKKILK